jgi:succinyl-CoA synthetase alpha subunit
MLFSDNMSIEEELSLKQLAQSKNLLVMGPDCGTAIISGVPLAFANAVRPGNIGVVGASGTGTQEVTTLIHNLGLGISHAIGTGGRDIKKEIGGISFLQALSMLNEDDNTKVILLVAKPPHQSVLDKIGLAVSKIKKPVVAVFLGADRESVEKHKMIFAKTLEEGALLACRLLDTKVQIEILPQRQIKTSGKYIRALYSGGTFCYETQLVLKELGLKDLYSNAPANGVNTLSNSNVSEAHTIVDLGEDEFTKGQPHPMIDYSLRIRRILEDIKRADTGVMILDLVIGFGSNLNPQAEFIPTIAEAKKLAPHVPIICFITGTDSDPQKRQELIGLVKATGAELVHTNAQAARLAASIVQGTQQ